MLTLFELFIQYMYFNVSSVNVKENQRNLGIPRMSYSRCLKDCRTIELSD